VGVDFHITKAKWADNEFAQISAEEWLAYIASDHELQFDPDKGPYHVHWLGQSAYEDPWLDWSSGRIYTKWPDTALYRKMLRIAKVLNAHVEDDNCTQYIADEDWEYDPNKIYFTYPNKEESLGETLTTPTLGAEKNWFYWLNFYSAVFWSTVFREVSQEVKSEKYNFGFLTLVIVFLVYLVTNLVTDVFGGSGYYHATRWPKVVATCCAAIAVGLVGYKLNRSYPAVTKKHCFLWLPMEYWSLIILALGLYAVFQ